MSGNGAADSVADPAADDPAPERARGAAGSDLSAEELDRGWGDRPPDPDRLREDDERLLRDRPPHWSE